MTNERKTRTTYHIVQFTKTGQYVGMAWNYDHAVMISTEPFATYGEARERLGDMADARSVTLHWFDGEYTCSGEGAQLLNAVHPHTPKTSAAR